jgi:SpoVK/Ycf46/Vps4 family AAA+-type ATPase
MLTRMETYNGIFIASTNDMEGIDTAALRRFDLKIKFEPLQAKQALMLLKNYSASFGLPEPNDYHKLALTKLIGLTPGDFAVLERQQRFRPFTDNNALIAALQAECALKAPFQRQPIGFV